MNKAVYIRFVCGCMLVVFGLSITPKLFLHDIFAKHIDNRPQRNSNAPYQLTNAGYNCDNDNLVAESSFISDQQVFVFPPLTSFSSYIIRDISFSSAAVVYAALRGPPQVGI